MNVAVRVSLLLASVQCSLGYRVCLSAIVRDEERVIVRFLANNAAAFDRVDITDTGSTDRTVEMAELYFRTNAMHGAVHYFAWSDDFGAARTYALERSREQQCDHIVFLDADEEVRVVDGARLLRSPSDTSEFAKHMALACPGVCQAQISSGEGNGRSGWRWWRLFAINGQTQCRFSGARHEVIDAVGVASTYLERYYVVAHRDQTRLAREPHALLLDALALERDIARGRNVPRSLYYAAQSYDQGGDALRALDMYRRRVACTDGWLQERFVAQLRVALLVERTVSFNASMAEFYAAMALDRSRAEPYYYLARGLRAHLQNYIGCYTMAREGLHRRVTPSHLFADNEIFEVSVVDEAAVCSSYLPEYRVESLELSLELLRKRPGNERFAANLRWTNATLVESFRRNELPTASARARLLRAWRQEKPQSDV